jgi:hypothetical protein
MLVLDLWGCDTSHGHHMYEDMHTPTMGVTIQLVASTLSQSVPCLKHRRSGGGGRMCYRKYVVQRFLRPLEKVHRILYLQAVVLHDLSTLVPAGVGSNRLRRLQRSIHQEMQHTDLLHC